MSGGGGGQVTLSGVGFTGDTNATYGAVAGTNLKDSGGTVLTDGAVKNSSISISSAGVLSGAGGGTVTPVGIGAIKTDASNAPTSVLNNSIWLDGNNISGIGTGTNTAVKNSAISIASNGSLSGGGGGQVTYAGVGGKAMGLIDSVTSANASTYIATAAIGSALIGSVAAGSILAGTISVGVKIQSTDGKFVIDFANKFIQITI